MIKDTKLTQKGKPQTMQHKKLYNNNILVHFL